jgi:predicted phage terminase large subunit-like protein
VQAALTERAERRLHSFVKQAWHVLEPTNPFVDGWHVSAVCEHLEAVTRGQIRRLIINVPPGFMKSLAVCVFWPCWVWLHHPESRWLYTSYSEDFALRDSRRCRDLIKSDWYQARWAERFRVRADQDSAGRFTNDRTGFRLATSVAGGATGERGDYIVTDDPIKIDDADSKAVRDAVNHWWDVVMSGRGADPNTSRFVVVQQRVHEDDLTGHLLKQGGYEHLFIPMEFESDRRCVTSIWGDPRNTEGELAWPERFNREAVEEWKKRLLAYGTAGQLQQQPAPMAGGGIFDSRHFRYFTEEGLVGGGTIFVLHGVDGSIRRVLAKDCRWIQTVDTAMKIGQDNDFTVVLTVAVTPARELLVVDVFRAQIEMPLQYGAVVAQRQKHPSVGFQAIEDKVSGTAIIQQGRLNGTPFKVLKADTDKLCRATHIAIAYQNGMVYHKAGAPWLTDFESELLLFPKGGHDDQVDCVAHAGNLAVTDAVLKGELDQREIVLWPPVRHNDTGLRIEDPDGNILSYNGYRIYLPDDEKNWWD